ncbi:MAG: hypothetical protein COV71_03055 [Candidatus Omnitrophica bacterium CG11_big_fil_rev_8_21_14_0_20_41_12]|nr:MAG: hypothetical protein COV71_03055 [Candidatus Omnitrophica bacterium CG11_big_fil_rev_8_21_14_0_20_41_12]
MAKEIKDLIAKIQTEGIKAAEDKAREIEAKAHAQAQLIIAQAHAQAKKITGDAQEQADKIRKSMETSLSQAGRDFLITLRAQVDTMLDKLVAENIRQSLTPEELFKIILALIKGATDKGSSQVIITLSVEDRKHLEKCFLKKLIEETKAQIVLKASDEISAGLRISFDAGKSHFDFSDTALAEYIALDIRPELARILKIK